MPDTPQQGLVAPASAGAPMTKTQLQTLSDLVGFAHAEYDGCQSYIEDLERFDRLLADMKIACARPFAAESVCGVDLAKEPSFAVLQIMRFPGETDEQFRDRVNRALAELDSTRPAPTRNPSNSRPKNTPEIGQFGKPKSIMDIVAGIRGIADNMESAAKKFDAEHAKDVRCRKHPHCFRHDDLMREVEYWRELADRIEAAVKREKQPGNAAAMRAALEAARRKARDCYDGGEYLGEGADPGFLQILAIIDAALAAQPRNCDRTKDEAEDLFKERFGRPWTQTEDELAAWLFDTIKENGGNKQ